MGFLPKEHWQKNLMELDCRMTEPFQRAIAEEWLAHENFREVLNAHIESGRKATESCWVSRVEEPWQFFNPAE
jgi:hypothetical protein